MASAGKKKTTMAKLQRESRMRERRMDKQARKLARKDAAAQAPTEVDENTPQDGVEGESAPDAEVETVSETA